MKVAVRYYSRGGNVKLMADALAKGAGVAAISIDDPEGPLIEPVDILFIGGAIYGFKLDPKLIQYIEDMPADSVRDRVICFGSSRTTRRPVYSLQELLKKRGFTIGKQGAYARHTPKPTALAAFEFFARKQVEKTAEEEALPPVAYMIRAVKDEMRAEAEEAAMNAEQAAAAALSAAAEEANAAAEAAARMAAEAAQRAKELAAQAAEKKAQAEALLHEAEQAEETAGTAGSEETAGTVATATTPSEKAEQDAPESADATMDVPSDAAGVTEGAATDEAGSTAEPVAESADGTTDELGTGVTDAETDTATGVTDTGSED